MDVVISSETLATLLDKDACPIVRASAIEDAEMCLNTKEEYAILVWNDEEVKDRIKERFNIEISDEHAVDVLNLIEETATKTDGVCLKDIDDLFELHLKSKYDK